MKASKKLPLSGPSAGPASTGRRSGGTILSKATVVTAGDRPTSASWSPPYGVTVALAGSAGSEPGGAAVYTEVGRDERGGKGALDGRFEEDGMVDEGDVDGAEDKDGYYTTV